MKRLVLAILLLIPATSIAGSLEIRIAQVDVRVQGQVTGYRDVAAGREWLRTLLAEGPRARQVVTLAGEAGSGQTTYSGCRVQKLEGKSSEQAGERESLDGLTLLCEASHPGPPSPAAETP